MLHKSCAALVELIVVFDEILNGYENEQEAFSVYLNDFYATCPRIIELKVQYLFVELLQSLRFSLECLDVSNYVSCNHYIYGWSLFQAYNLMDCFVEFKGLLDVKWNFGIYFVALLSNIFTVYYDFSFAIINVFFLFRDVYRHFKSLTQWQLTCAIRIRKKVLHLIDLVSYCYSDICEVRGRK